MLGYPDFVAKEELDKSLRTWFGRTDFGSAALAALSLQLRTAVQGADIVGVPRPKQQLKSAYQPVIEAIRTFGLIDERQVLTDSAIHRYLQFGLFYRRLLANLEFCGLVSCRNLAPELRSVFGVGRVAEYLVPGESAFPGEYAGSHFPDRFEELRTSLHVPFRGAVFLVGAGALGKIYCQWIKQAGGIAIDIGAICDAWSPAQARLRRPWNRLQAYRATPSISLHDAILRYNGLCDRFALDSARLSPADYPRAAQTFF